MNIKEFKQTLKNNLLQYEDSEGSALRQNYNDDYWKGARVMLKNIINIAKELKEETKNGTKKNIR